MSALVPYNYHGLSPENYFGSHKRKKNYYYDKRFMGQQPFIPRPFPAQSYYPPYFYPNRGYPPTDFSQFGRTNMTTDLVSFNRSNEQYRFAQYIRALNTMQNRYWKREASSMPPPMYTEPYPFYQTSGEGYLYEQEIRYLPYPVPVGPGGEPLTFGGKLGPGYPSITGPTGGLTTIVAHTGGTMGLPPKIRVIFMPTGFPYSYSQQPCTGALGMPPFLFNRISQPFCSLPLPPPLPQISSLPLTPVVQQMVLQQYANPVAVLPYTSNWQMARPMISTYPQFSQQSIAPISALTTPPYIPQSYIPPTLLPANMPMLPYNAGPFSDAIPSQASYSNSSYPSTCRACIPQPPSLNIPVTGHNWVQHCSACHHVPADATNPNIRSNNGRSTPLLLHPTVRQNAYNPTIQQQQYPYINTSVATRPWLYEMPPLPPGATIISDEYVPMNNIGNASHFSKNFILQPPRVFNSASRSMILPATTINQNKTNKTKSERKGRKKHKDGKSKLNTKSTSITSSSSSVTPPIGHTSSSSSSSCSLCKAARAKKQTELDTDSHNTQQNTTLSPSVATEAHNVNLRYNYKPPDLHSVYNNNSDLKTSDSDSLSTSNPIALPKYLHVNVHCRDILLSPISNDSIVKEDQKSNHTSSPVPSQLERCVKKIIIIRQFRTNSPSTISTISSNRSFRIVDNDFDSISTTSTIKPDPIKESTDDISEIF